MKTSIQQLKVLKVFLEAPSESFSGADICRQAELASGTVYPILARLEQVFWLESQWEEKEPKDRPRKRLYTLTRTGFTKSIAEFNVLSLGGKYGYLEADFA